MKKKLLCALLCVSMVATALVGCGGSTEEAAPADDAAVEEAAPAEDAAEEAAPAEDAAAPAEDAAASADFAKSSLASAYFPNW